MQDRMLALWMILLGTLILVTFPFHHQTSVLYLPMIFAIWAILTHEPGIALRMIFAYLPFEGAFKVISSYDLIIRLSIDLMILAMLLRLIIMDRGQTLLRTFYDTPASRLFFLLLGWVLVQVLNPYGLGILPALASYKVYVSALLLYFFAYQFSADDHHEVLRDMAWICCGIVGLQVVFTLYQWNGREAALALWSPNYQGLLGDRFTGVFFRPFGTAQVAGGGATFVFLCFPITIALLLEQKKFLPKISLSLLIISSTSVLFLSQVRSSIVKALFSTLVIALLLLWKKPQKALPLLMVLAGLAAGVAYYFQNEDPRLKVARERFETLSDAKKAWGARADSGIWEHTMIVVREAPFGIGLSRVGAAASPFVREIEADKRFGPEFSFADNLYRALVIELGIPGLLLFMTLLLTPVFTILYRVLTRPHLGLEPGGMLIIGALAMGLSSVIGHWGSEGSLYQPESTFLWLFLGLAMRASESTSEEE